ncbi:MAG: efflux RND transporter periplasmic adaptor subunit [Cytophagaceae bacterium]|nr:efflux RND transporter periplasmic adaptor subunit [Cytophagaceae bacterium]
MKNNTTKYLLYSLTILFILSCGKETPEEALGGGKKEEEQKSSQIELTAEQFKIAGIELGEVTPRALSDVITVSGVVDVPPQNLISISAPLGGFIKSTKLLPGNQVKKGDVIAVIENVEFITLQQDYLETKNKLEYMQQEYERQKTLNKESVTSTKLLQQTESDYKSLKVRLKSLEEKLALIGINARQLDENTISRSVSIRSGIDGHIKSVNVNIGKYVNPTDVLFEIENTSDVHLQLNVFERNATYLQKGQKIKFSLPNEPSKERTATIYLIGKSIADDKTVNVHAHINEQDKSIMPGMFVKARIETGHNEVPALPDAAIVQSGGKNYIFTFAGKTKENNQGINQFNMIEVQLGVSEDGFTEVVLPENIHTNSTQVVIKGAYVILSKMNNSEE